MRDRLIELLRQRSCYYVDCKGRSCAGCQNVFIQDSDIESIADHLLANGVIVPPCKVGGTVYVCNRTAGKVFKNTVVGIFLSGASPHRNGIKCEYRNICGETSNRKFTFAQIGKTIFLTREEAEQALKEKE